MKIKKSNLHEYIMINQFIFQMRSWYGIIKWNLINHKYQIANKKILLYIIKSQTKEIKC